jgi:hypothetical protein
MSASSACTAAAASFGELGLLTGEAAYYSAVQVDAVDVLAVPADRLREARFRHIPVQSSPACHKPRNGAPARSSPGEPELRPPWRRPLYSPLPQGGGVPGPLGEMGGDQILQADRPLPAGRGQHRGPDLVEDVVDVAEEQLFLGAEVQVERLP